MCVCVCVCVCARARVRARACVLQMDVEKSRVFTSTALAVVWTAVRVSDRFQLLSDRFPQTTFDILQMSCQLEKMSSATTMGV